jgi:hypothetical protein
MPCGRISEPVPASLKFLNDQGAWYTPFDRAGNARLLRLCASCTRRPPNPSIEKAMNALKWITVFLCSPFPATVEGRCRCPSGQNANGWPMTGGKLLRASYSPLHFKPAIESATDAQCLACHKEVLDDNPALASPAGLRAADSLAWYQQTEHLQRRAGQLPSPPSGDADGEAVDEPQLHHLPPGPGPARRSPGLLGDGNAANRCRIHAAQAGQSRDDLPQVPRPVSRQGDHGPAGAVAGEAKDMFQNDCLGCHARSALRATRSATSMPRRSRRRRARPRRRSRAATSATAATAAAPGIGSPTPMRAIPGPACPRHAGVGAPASGHSEAAFPATSAASPARERTDMKTIPPQWHGSSIPRAAASSRPRGRRRTGWCRRPAGNRHAGQAAEAFAYEPYLTDDQLTTVVTSCDHNCGSRHMLVAHKKGDVIVRLSTDDGRYQEAAPFGFDTERSRSCAPACAAAPTARASIRPSACSTR